jgi:hypothetical protein
MILWSSSTCFGQITYKATFLGRLPAYGRSIPLAVNDAGRIVGDNDNEIFDKAILWDQAGTAAQLIVPGSYYPVEYSWATGINNSGLVVGSFGPVGGPLRGYSYLYDSNTGVFESFSPVGASCINEQGTVAGSTLGSEVGYNGDTVAFTYSPATGLALHPPSALGSSSWANAINDSGDLAGAVGTRASPAIYNAATSRWIEVSLPSGAAGGRLEGINDSGWVVGQWGGNFGTQPIIANKDGSIINVSLPISVSLISLRAVNNAGLAVGYGCGPTACGRPLAYDIQNNAWIDLSTKVVNPELLYLFDLYPYDLYPYGISSDGKIVGEAIFGGEEHGFLLTPIIPYKVHVQPPINRDGTSEFKAARGAVPVKFTLTKDDNPTCNLPPATISVTRTTGESAGFIDASTYESHADKIGPKFGIAGCQYTYILQTKALGKGNYRVDLIIEGYVIGGAEFALVE